MPSPLPEVSKISSSNWVGSKAEMDPFRFMGTELIWFKS